MVHALRLLSGLLLSLGLAFSLSGCLEPPCGPSTCFGCCTATGECVGGILQNQCGTSGNQCDVCVVTQACQAGRCVSVSGAGGGAGTGGGGGTGAGTGGGGPVDPRLVCNTSGVATGCTAELPFSCEAATKCYQSLDGCRVSTECGGTGTGGGGGTATGGGTGGGTPTGGGAGGGGGSTGARTVTGLATYEFVPVRYVEGQGGGVFFSQATRRPIRNATIRVVENGTTVLGTAVTGEDGRYAVSFNPGAGALQVQVLARSQSPSIQVEDNTANNATWGFGATLTAGVNTVDLNAPHGWTGTSYGANRRAAPFAILDTMYTAAKAFVAVRPAVNFPALKVNWSPNNAPQGGNTAAGQIGTSHFSPRENEIYVLGLAGADTDEFDTHVIVHEWGHYFEDNVSRSDSPGGPHGNGDVLDPRIAFGEAWGTAVAAMVLPETMYSDSRWSNGQLGAWGYDAETAASGDDPSPNVFSENSVLRVLYDLYDSAADGAHDQVAVGLGAVYDVMTGPQVQTDAVTSIGPFVSALKARGFSAGGIDATLAAYGMGPIANDFGQGDTNLLGMFTNASVPYTGGIDLLGGFESNTYQQNQYFVFTGTGRTVNISAGNATHDVGVFVYRRGTYLGGSDRTTSGTESLSIPSTAGAIYVVVVTGYAGPMNQQYAVSVSIQSP